MSDIMGTKSDDTMLIVTFYIDNARFGIDADRVQEIIQQKKTTTVHHAPPFVRGIINLRGKVVTVVDIGEKLRLGTVVPGNENRILIVDWQQEHVGCLVDSIAEVAQIGRNGIEHPPGNVNGVQSDLIAGVFRNTAGQLVGLLDIDKMMAIANGQQEQRKQ